MDKRWTKNPETTLDVLVTNSLPFSGPLAKVILLSARVPTEVPVSLASEMVVPLIVHVPKLVSPARGEVVYWPVCAVFVRVRLMKPWALPDWTICQTPWSSVCASAEYVVATVMLWEPVNTGLTHTQYSAFDIVRVPTLPWVVTA